ncbi:MAG: DPP IV N-terminal domain-containing protein [Candidatus Neomarinimicrobiota bacterium]
MKRLILFFAVVFSLQAAEPIDLPFIFQQPLRYGTVPISAKWSPDDSKMAFLWNEKGGRFRDIYIKDIDAIGVQRITSFGKNPSLPPTDLIRDLVWSPDGKTVVFEFQNNIYQSGIRRDDKPAIWIPSASRPAFSPNRKYIVYEKNADYWIQEISSGKTARLTGALPAENTLTNHPFFAGTPHFRWSSDGKSIAFIETKDKQTPCLIIRQIEMSQVRIADVRFPIDPQSIVRDFRWAPNNQSIAVDKIAADLSKRFLLRLDVWRGVADTLYRETNPKCVGAFGGKIFWIDGGQRLLFGSATNGYDHLYTVKIESHIVEALTRGQFNVIDYCAENQKQKIFYTSDEVATETHVFSVDPTTDKSEKLTFRKGIHSFTPSNSGEKLAEVFSSLQQIPELFWSSASPNSKMFTVTQSTSTEMEDYRLKLPLTKSVRNPQTGRLIYYHLWLPEKDLVSSKYPVILNVSEETRSHKIRNAWSVNGLVNQWLCDQKFIVAEMTVRLIDADSIGYSISDMKTVLNEISKYDFANINRAGILGAHFGGYDATVAMFAAPDLFKAGVAITALPEWQEEMLAGEPNILPFLFDHIDTGQISERLNSYPNLTGHLLFAQGNTSSIEALLPTAALTQKMTEARKHVDFIFYPWKNQCIESDETAIDLYQKIYEYFRRYLR